LKVVPVLPGPTFRPAVEVTAPLKLEVLVTVIVAPRRLPLDVTLAAVTGPVAAVIPPEPLTINEPTVAVPPASR